MLRTILVPYDGSAQAEQALACGVAIGRAAGARLLLVRASTPINKAVLSSAASLVAVETRELSELARVADELSERAERLRSDGVVAAARIGVGTPAEVIVDAAGVTDADLIVMASSQRSRLGHRLQRGTIYGLLGKAPVPVLAVPPNWKGWNVHDDWRRILVPLDGSAVSEDALLPAQALAAALSARIELLRVVPPPGAAVFPHGFDGVARLQEADLDDAREALQRLAAKMRATGQAADIRVVLARDAAAAIAGTARREGVGLIAMSTRGHGPLRGVLMGSVASATLQRSRVPVLIVRAGVARPTAVRELTGSSSSPTETNPDVARIPVARPAYPFLGE